MNKNTNCSHTFMNNSNTSLLLAGTNNMQVQCTTDVDCGAHVDVHNVSKVKLTNEVPEESRTSTCEKYSTEKSLLQIFVNKQRSISASVTAPKLGDEAEDIGSGLSNSIIQQEIEIVNSALKTASNFEPIILNVCGGYHEMEAEDINENNNLASLEPAMFTQRSENNSVCNTSAENNHAADLVSVSAFELLKGMARHAVSENQMSKEVSLNCETHTSATNSVINCASVHTEPPSETNKVTSPERNENCLALNPGPITGTHSSNKTLVLSKEVDTPLSDSSLFHIPVKVPLSTSIKTSTAGVVTSSVSSESMSGKSQTLLSNINGNPTKSSGLQTYSCVFVQDRNSSMQNKMAFLVPQSSPPDLSYLNSITSSVLSKSPVTELHTNVNSIHKNQSSTQSSTGVTTSRVPVQDSIFKLVTKTVNDFYLQGKDLKGTHLLKVVSVRRNEPLHCTVRCHICNEGFCDQEGLDFHLNRTAFHLLFDCSYCKQKMVFYNKCLLWMHLKSEAHKTVLNYNDILCLIPYEYDTEDSSDNLMNETENTSSSQAIHCSPDISKSHTFPISTAASMKKVTPVSSVSSSTVSVLPVSQFIDKYSQCPVCEQHFLHLSAHMSSITANKCLCPLCGMSLPSLCAREAHMKIHSGVAKDICCPECGEKDFKVVHGDEDMRSVFDHVDACRHFNRVLSIKCFCKQELNSVGTLAYHFTECHFRSIFKCPLCALAFTQHDSFTKHLDSVHKVKDTNIGASVLCLYCQRILKSCAELKIHLDQHVEHFSNGGLFKWKCFICAKLFADKAELNKHAECDHPHKSKRCTICYSLFWSRKCLVEHIVQKKCLRSVAKKFNFCVDLQPEEVGKSPNGSLNLSKLFESKQIRQNTSETHRQTSCAPVVPKKPLLVKIAPKRVAASDQSVATLQSSQQLQKRQQNIELTQPIGLQKQAATGVVPSSNKVSPQPCKIIITSKSNSSKSIIVSQCSVCKQIVESTKLTEHLKDHQSQGVLICIYCKKQDFTTIKDAQKHSELCGHNMLKQTEAPAEPKSNNSMEEENSSEANSGSKDTSKDKSDHQHIDTNDRNVENQTQSVFPCLMCGLAFQNLAAREEHVSRSHDGTKTVYRCGLCRKKGKSTVFARKELVSRHITKKHRIVNRETVNKIIRIEEQNASSGQKLQASKPSEDMSAPKRLRVAGEGDYMCGKCGFSSSKPDEFSQHISLHNSTKEPQCPECGLCFTIFPALKIHLMAVHKIRAVDDYLKTNNVAEPDIVEEEEFDVLPEIHPYNKPLPKSLDSSKDKPNTSMKIPSTNPLECNVCYKVFDAEANLKTHMRNHGMAFIRSKRHKI